MREGLAVMVMEYGFDNLPRLYGSEATEPVQWPQRVLRKSRSEAAYAAVSLEDEISSLRQKMEDAFLQSDSLTSELVMELSRLLDLKIIEYMNKGKKE